MRVISQGRGGGGTRAFASPARPPQSLNELVYAELRRQILWGEIAARHHPLRPAARSSSG